MIEHSKALKLSLGVKADPIEYRYSYDWLFRLMAEEGVCHAQIGSFFELYQLPDDYFLELRRTAEFYGVTLSSLFTSHRELGGFFSGHPAWEAVARKSFERFIEVAALLGAPAAGSNPGAVPRDHMDTKDAGSACYLRHMKELMAYAHTKGLQWLTIEPMSCLAEPPTLPEEIRHYAEELNAHHCATPGTARAGYCFDVSHGYADQNATVRHGWKELLETALPDMVELHLKNTDTIYNSTFGFTELERERGIVDVAEVRDFLLDRADVLPVDEVIGYFEISGPKLGRDYSDCRLEAQLRESLRHLRETYSAEAAPAKAPAPAPAVYSGPVVQIAPSMMCADMCHLEDSVRGFEALGVDMLHLDLMDAKFTPNMPLGLETIRQLRPRTKLPFDVHLMVEDNDFFVRQLADMGVEMISVHVESALHLERTLALIQDKGIKAGAALNPATPLDWLRYVLHCVDFVLLMTVNPGFAGQKLVPSAFDKIRDCRAFLGAMGRGIPIEVDGNVSFGNIPRMVACGADILVAGSSSLFSKSAAPSENMKRMREGINKGLAARGQDGAAGSETE